MPKLRFALLSFLMLLAWRGLAAAKQAVTKPASGAPAWKKLGAFVGVWKGHGTMLDTAFSKAADIDSVTDCRFVHFGEYLVCDLTSDDKVSRSTHHQLTVYSAGEDGTYTYIGVPAPGAQPHFDHLTIEGNTWTYAGSMKQGNKSIQFRTTNIFGRPDQEEFTSEYSEDSGQHWIAMLHGMAHKVGK
jgi:hypothetical protein